MNELILNADAGTTTISRHIYGHFSEHLGRCIYGGFWEGENSAIPNTRGIRNDVIAALKEIQIPNLRWPGGCFADEYHWRDGIGPRENRPTMVNTHVFNMYKVHQGATLLPTTLKTADYAFEDKKIPALSVSASKNAGGAVHISLCNSHATDAQPITISLRGGKFTTITGRILTADAPNAHNTFDAPETLTPTDFPDARLADNTIIIELPAKSVLVLAAS